jgi:hypothetical protein
MSAREMSASEQSEGAQTGREEQMIQLEARFLCKYFTFSARIKSNRSKVKEKKTGSKRK